MRQVLSSLSSSFPMIRFPVHFLAAMAVLIGFSGTLSAELIEEWNFDAPDPQTGINGMTQNAWVDSAPNSVPSTGVLRYATSGNGNAPPFPRGAIETSTIERAILTIDLADMVISGQVIFQFGQTGGAGNMEVEFNSDANGQFSLDVEGNGSTLASGVLLDRDDFPGAVPLLVTVTWDFANDQMSYAVSGSVTASESIAADLSGIARINWFRPRGGTMLNGAFLDLDTVTIEVDPIPVAPTDLIVVEDFEDTTHSFLKSGNLPVVVADPDARAGSYVIKSQLTPDSPDPERTEVSLRTQPKDQPNGWNFDIDQEYWVGISIKLDNDFDDDSTFDDTGMLLQWHYYDWMFPDSEKPQPLIIRYDDNDTIRVQFEMIDASENNVRVNLETGIDPAYGEWVDWVINLKFSDTDGFFRIWRNGQQIVDWTGDNHYHLRPNGAYMKFGLYSSQYDPVTYTNGATWGNPMDPGSSRTVYHDEVRVADSTGSYAAVVPRSPRADPVITAFNYSDATLALSFSADALDAAEDFVIESSAALSGFTPDSSADPVTGSNGSFQTTIPFSGSTQFYRVVRQDP
jgi:hypothetical protein